jgi:hypothetical protein
MNHLNHRRSASLALLAAATAVLATACTSPGTGTSASGATTSATATASGASAVPSASTAQTTGVAPVSSKGPTPKPTQAAPTTKPAGATGGNGSGGTGTGGTGGNATSDAYAWKHPCDPAKVGIRVEYQQGIGDTRRIIVATNHGSTACGLSYYPSVLVADSRSVGGTSHPTSFASPKVPGGLGGAPYASIHAGTSLYAVIDLDPGHTTSGAVRTFDELDVRAADFMPDAATYDLPLKAHPTDTANPYVKGPILSLYQPSIADAVTQVGTLSDFP